jgi:hypothetical protein
VTYDDEILMAYADGELDEAQRAAISAAVEKDPELARRVERHRATRARVAGAFARVLDQPLPEKLITAARGADAVSAAGSKERRGEVVQFPSRASVPQARRWGAREWAAMAASLVLGVLASWQWLAPQEPYMSPRNGALVASGGLATALDAQLASAQREDDAVQIGVSFRSRAGEFCRSFALREAGTAGLACRAGDEWRISVTAAAAEASGGMRQAAAAAPAVLKEIEARISGEPLDAAGEKAALAGGWQQQ